MALFGSGKGKTLYYPGALTSAKLPIVVAATKGLLRDMGISFVTLELPTSGFSAWFAGYRTEFERIKSENLELFKKEGITKVITNDPHAALAFIESGIPAEHIVSVLKEHIAKIKKGDEERVSYHHPCFLDRLGISARQVHNILRRGGIHVSNEHGSDCCGSVGHDFERNNPKAATLLAKECAKRLGEKVIVTCCPHCYLLLKKQRRAVKDITEMLFEE